MCTTFFAVVPFFNHLFCSSSTRQATFIWHISDLLHLHLSTTVRFVFITYSTLILVDNIHRTVHDIVIVCRVCLIGINEIKASKDPPPISQEWSRRALCAGLQRPRLKIQNTSLFLFSARPGSVLTYPRTNSTQICHLAMKPNISGNEKCCRYILKVKTCCFGRGIN